MGCLVAEASTERTVGSDCLGLNTTRKDIALDSIAIVAGIVVILGIMVTLFAVDTCVSLQELIAVQSLTCLVWYM